MRLTGVLGTHFHPDHLGGRDGRVVARRDQHPPRKGAGADPRPGGRGPLGRAHDGRRRGRPGGPPQRRRRCRSATSRVEMIHTPGHTPGSQCFLVDGRLVAGDTLFLEGCGRTDFPGSDPLAMYESIHTRSARVPDEAILFPGHLYSQDPSQSMGETQTLELRLPATLGRGVDGDVRLMSPSGGIVRRQQGHRRRAHRSPDGGRSRRCAPRASRARSLLVGEERHLPYDRPPLSKQVLAGTWPPEKAVLADNRRASRAPDPRGPGSPRRPPRRCGEEARARRRHRCWRVTASCIATGARPRPLPGTDGLRQRDGLFTLRTLDDSLALRAAVTAVDAARVVVIGAGFIGAEVASTCADLGCRVTVLEALDVPLRNVLGPPSGPTSPALHESHGVDLRTGVGVQRHPTGGRRARRTRRAGSSWNSTAGRRSRRTSSWWASACCPATEWLADSGLTVDNGVVCDDRLFAADGIVAAGDVARWQWRRDGGEEQIRIEHWQVAAEAGVAAARQPAGRPG